MPNRLNIFSCRFKGKASQYLLTTMYDTRPGVAIPFSINCGGAGGVITAGLLSSPLPSQTGQA